jgi:hypothetical protein
MVIDVLVETWRERVVKTKHSHISHLQKHSASLKSCRRCRRDIGREWRSKTSDGKYCCRPCLRDLQKHLQDKSLSLFDNKSSMSASGAKLEALN